MTAKTGAQSAKTQLAKSGSKLEAKFHHALSLHQQDKGQQAGKLYRAILKAQPNHPGALHYLGMLHHQQDDSEKAIKLIGQSIRQQPDYFDAIMNLGNVLQETERFTEADECYRKAIDLRPTEASAYSNLGVSLRRQSRLKEAIEVGRKSTELDPEYLITWYNLGNTYKVAHVYKQAIVCFQETIRIQPDLSIAHSGLCQATFQQEYQSLLGRVTFSKTKQAYGNWLASEPNNALAKFMLQALSRDSKLSRMPDEVVSSMFNQFADSFEQQLQTLQYSLPEKMASMLQDLLGPPASALRVLDGGCGTGLCGPALKPWASHLIGVDISSAMLDKARPKGHFDKLVESELTGFLKQHSGHFDLAVYADTLIYFGDLNAVLNASKGALDHHGSIIFTLETSNKNTAQEVTSSTPMAATPITVSMLKNACKPVASNELKFIPIRCARR